MNRVRALLMVVLLSGMSSGCFEQESDTCEYWATKLTSAAKAERALQGVEELQCTNAWPTLEKLWDDSQFRARIVRLIKQVGDKEGSLPIVRKALKNREHGKLMATIVEDWKLAAVEPELLEILTGDILPKHRKEVLSALLSFKKPQDVEDLLIQLAANDPGEQGFMTNKIALDALGDMRSQKAIPTVIKAAFVRTVTGDRLYTAARGALGKIGPATVPLLIKTIRGENDDLIEYAKEAGIHEFEWKSGPEIVQLLTDTLDMRVGIPCIESLAAPLEPPSGVSPAVMDQWRNAQRNRFQVLTFGLGHLGPTDVFPMLEKILTEVEEMNQRQNAMAALAYIGTKEAQDLMLKAYAAQDTELVQRNMVEDMTRGLDWDHYEAWMKAFRGKVPEKIEESLKSEWNLAYVAVLNECKNDAGCVIKQLDSEDKHRVVKAALMLAQGMGDDKAVVDTLYDHFVAAPTDQIDIRRFTLMGLTRRGGKEIGHKLAELAKDSNQKQFWQMELEAFGNYLEQRVPEGEHAPAPAPAPEAPAKDK